MAKRKPKQRHEGAIASARQRFLRDKLKNGQITKEEYEAASPQPINIKRNK